MNLKKTELWVALLGMFSPHISQALGQTANAEWQGLAASVLAGLYIGGRSYVKAKTGTDIGAP